MNVFLYQLCCAVLDYVFPEDALTRRYHHFKISMVNKKYKSKHGDYHPKDRKIRVFNLDRDKNAIIKTVFHELAHHVDHEQRNHSDHSKRFYEIYEKLLVGVIEMQVLSKEDVLSIEDHSSDMNKIKKRIKESKINPTVPYKDDCVLFKVKNCYVVKEQLKERHYSYNHLDSCWQKEIQKEEIEEEKRFLYSIVQPEQLEISDVLNISFDSYQTIAVYQSYEQRALLKQRGYYYHSDTKSWRKKVKQSDVEAEKMFLKEHRFPKVKIL